jgi:uncharacterized protein
VAERCAADPTRKEPYSAAHAHLEGAAIPADPVKGLQFLNPSAAKGHAPSQSSLGFLYEQGGRDFAAAAGWYGKAADHDDEMGLCYLAVLLLQGRGVAKDPAQAMRFSPRRRTRTRRGWG